MTEQAAPSSAAGDAGRELPPLPGPEASDDERGQAIEARFFARAGHLPTLADWRRVYAEFGQTPPDHVIRQRHPVADTAA